MLSDPAVVSADSVTKLIFVSGKHYYTLSKHIQENNINVSGALKFFSLNVQPKKSSAGGLLGSDTPYPYSAKVLTFKAFRNDSIYILNIFQNIAVIRLESICPFPTGRLQTELAKYKNAQGESFFRIFNWFAHFNNL